MSRFHSSFFEWLAGHLGKPMPPSVPADAEDNRKRGVTNKQVSNQRLKRILYTSSILRPSGRVTRRKLGGLANQNARRICTSVVVQKPERIGTDSWLLSLVKNFEKRRIFL